jgi:hypothetical protein
MSPANLKLIENEPHDHHETAFRRDHKEHRKCCLLGLLAVSVLVASILSIGVIYLRS